MKDIFDDTMEANRPTQTASAREVMFANTMAAVSRVPEESPVLSPYAAFSYQPSRVMVAGILALCLIVGTGGTVAAAESAKPGDVLFSVDQVTEAMRLLLATNEQKAALQSQFLDERQRELAAIIAEEMAMIEKEIGDIAPAAAVTEDGEKRITRAVDEFLRQAEQLPKSDTEGRRQAVAALINEVRVHGRAGDDMRLRIDDDRFEIRTEDMRIRSREGEAVEVRNDDDDNDDRGSDANNSGRGDDGDSDDRHSNSGSFEKDDSDDTADDRDDDRHDRGDDDVDQVSRDEDDKAEDEDSSGSGKDDDDKDDDDKDEEDDHSGKSDNDDD